MIIRDGGVEQLTTTGDVAWRFAPHEMKAIGLWPVPAGTDAIVLLEALVLYRKGVPTIVRLDEHGELVWTAQVRKDGDGTYVWAEVGEDVVLADTWDGWRVTLDLTSGRIRDAHFTK